jgi:hypothetical protein
MSPSIVAFILQRCLEGLYISPMPREELACVMYLSHKTQELTKITKV